MLGLNSSTSCLNLQNAGIPQNKKQTNFYMPYYTAVYPELQTPTRKSNELVVLWLHGKTQLILPSKKCLLSLASRVRGGAFKGWCKHPLVQTYS